MKDIGVYLIVHRESGLTYVGQSNNIPNRWGEHLEQLHDGSHHNRKLLELWREHGGAAFEFRVASTPPDGLSPLETQRWLAKKEEEIYWDLQKTKKALNIVVPEIVETAAAFEEFKHKEKDIEKAEARQVKLANSAVSADVRDVKSKLSDLRKEIFRVGREVEENARQVDTARFQLLRNTGWRRFLLGQTDQRSTTELERVLQAADSNLAAVKSKLLQLESTETTLRSAQKDLFRSYPRNRARQIRRSNFYVAIHTGSLWKRKPRIR